MFLKSVQTGKYCRTAQIEGQLQFVCDQDTPGTAITYTGPGMALNGQPFINPGDGKPGYFAPATSGDSNVAFVLPPISTTTPVSFFIPGKGYLRIDSTTGYAVCTAPVGMSHCVRMMHTYPRFKCNAGAPLTCSRTLQYVGDDEGLPLRSCSTSRLVGKQF
jgi:hypothetical protein